MSTVSAARRPNILFVCVDELRYPSHFPRGIDSPDAFMQKFMPNVYDFLWSRGVRFSRYYTAAADCSPARGTFVTGLYAQQTNLMIVRATQASVGEAPPLNPAFPTYGKILAECQYDTPYIGKWHLSDAPAMSPVGFLADYGFQGLTIPDPNGVAGQGIGEALPPNQMGDHEIALQAVEWLHTRAAQIGNDKPFCLTVGFINPHDKQWFWSGPEGETFANVYAQAHTTPFSGPLQEFIDEHPGPAPRNIASEDDPPPLGYDVPSNWQCKADMKNASTPTIAQVFAELTDFACGGISDVPDGLGFYTRPSLLCEGWNAAVAPDSYWTRALDMYTQAMQNVDREIGLLFSGIPPEVLENLVVVFTSDHGEYASSHGLQGKGVTAYEETMNVPLIVRDLGGVCTAFEETERTQIGSHVDLLRLLLDIANDGSAWMLDGDYAQMYGSRHDLYSILRDPKLPGRQFAAYTCDEVFLPAALNYLGAPDHATALMFPDGKFTAFSYWDRKTGAVDTTETFYYDRTAAQGLLELESSAPPIDSATLLAMIAAEVRAPLPAAYAAAQQEALDAYWTHVALVNVAALLAVAASSPKTGEDALIPPPAAVYMPAVNAP